MSAKPQIAQSRPYISIALGTSRAAGPLELGGVIVGMSFSLKLLLHVFIYLPHSALRLDITAAYNFLIILECLYSARLLLSWTFCGNIYVVA